MIFNIFTSKNGNLLLDRKHVEDLRECLVAQLPYFAKLKVWTPQHKDFFGPHLGLGTTVISYMIKWHTWTGNPAAQFILSFIGIYELRHYWQENKKSCTKLLDWQKNSFGFGGPEPSSLPWHYSYPIWENIHNWIWTSPFNNPLL